jgi:acid phosphatase
LEKNPTRDGLPADFRHVHRATDEQKGLLMKMQLYWLVLGSAAFAWESANADDLLPTPDHVVVVVEENHSYSQIIGNASAPYINQLAQAGASFTNSHGIEHPSQPNYLDLFSGSNQGVTADLGVSGLGARWPFSTPNLAAQLLSHGRTFTGYSESLPYLGYTGDGDLNASMDNYRAKHNPWVQWQNDHPTSPNQLPSSINRPFSDFAQTHNSLLIVTFDEDDGSQGNRIPTIFAGPMVRPGQYDQMIDHYSVLRTLEDMYGLGDQGYLGAAAGRGGYHRRLGSRAPDAGAALLRRFGVALLVPPPRVHGNGAASPPALLTRRLSWSALCSPS